MVLLPKYQRPQMDLTMSPNISRKTWSCSRNNSLSASLPEDQTRPLGHGRRYWRRRHISFASRALATTLFCIDKNSYTLMSTIIPSAMGIDVAFELDKIDFIAFYTKATNDFSSTILFPVVMHAFEVCIKLKTLSCTIRWFWRSYCRITVPLSGVAKAQLGQPLRRHL